MELFLTSFFFFLSFIAHLLLYTLWKLIPLKIVCIRWHWRIDGIQTETFWAFNFLKITMNGSYVVKEEPSVLGSYRVAVIGIGHLNISPLCILRSFMLAGSCGISFWKTAISAERACYIGLTPDPQWKERTYSRCSPLIFIHMPYLAYVHSHRTYHSIA